MSTKPFKAFSLLLPAILFTVLLSGCGQAPKPVSASSIPGYGSGEAIAQASAFQQGLPITVWGLKGDTLTSGPFSGWKIDKDESGTLCGLKEYLISPGSGSSVQDFYTNGLSADKWAKGDDISGDGFGGYSWKRGNQAFIAVIVETKSACILITYLLNK